MSLAFLSCVSRTAITTRGLRKIIQQGGVLGFWLLDAAHAQRGQQPTAQQSQFTSTAMLADWVLTAAPGFDGQGDGDNGFQALPPRMTEVQSRGEQANEAV